MKTNQELAIDRIAEMGFDQEQFEFIFADWQNMDEHLAWLLTASREEINDWGEASNWGRSSDNEELIN
ncbi:MAG TPA: hypothetical protein DDY37_07950 [Legionella sp.]|nr:hypothetical protein [Legionella sp.]